MALLEGINCWVFSGIFCGIIVLGTPRWLLDRHDPIGRTAIGLCTRLAKRASECAGGCHPPAAAHHEADQPAVPIELPPPAANPPTADDICRTLEQAAAENGIPVEFFARVIWQSSERPVLMEYVDDEATQKRLYEALLKLPWLAPKVRNAIMWELGRSQREEDVRIEKARTLTFRHEVSEVEARMRANGERPPRGDIHTAAVEEVAETAVEAFGESLIETINPVTGRLHTNFLIAGARSGRFSARGPNLQQSPKQREAGFRKIFAAPAGWLVMALDYSQIELRAVAELISVVRLRQDIAAVVC